MPTPDFRGATDALMELGATMDDVATAFGVSLNTANRWRMDPSSPNSRNPPKDWRSTLADFARERGSAYSAIARRLTTRSTRR